MGATGVRHVQKGHDMYIVSPSDKTELFETFKPLPQQVITGIEKFVLFVGNIITGHTMIASLMDAHPNMIVSNEYLLINKVFQSRTEWLKNKTSLFNKLYEHSWRESHNGMTSISKALSGAHYGVGIISNYSWHGMYRNLKVIGDKCGKYIVSLYQQDPTHFRQLLKQLSDTLQIPMIRNPYDAVATKCLGSVTTQQPTETNKYNNPTCLKRIMTAFFSVEDWVMRMKNDAELNLNVLDIHNADYVKFPVETVRKVCEFFEVDCPEGYLQACKEKAYSSTRKTRKLVAWPKELVKDFDRAMKKFPFLQRYSYESD